MAGRKGSSPLISSPLLFLLFFPHVSSLLIPPLISSNVLSDPCSCHFHSIPTSSCLSSRLVLIFIFCLLCLSFSFISSVLPFPPSLFCPPLHHILSLHTSPFFCLFLSLHIPISPVTSHHCCSPSANISFLLSSQLSWFLLSSPLISSTVPESPLLLSLLFCLSSSMSSSPQCLSSLWSGGHTVC